MSDLGISGDRLYRALAFFDTRDGTFEAAIARSAREGYERDAMGEDGAWGEFDRLVERHNTATRTAAGSHERAYDIATDALMHETSTSAYRSALQDVADNYQEWCAWWGSLTPEERAEDLHWQAVYASESSRGGF